MPLTEEGKDVKKMGVKMELEVKLIFVNLMEVVRDVKKMGAKVVL